MECDISRHGVERGPRRVHALSSPARSLGRNRPAGHRLQWPNPAWDSARPDPASSNAPYRLFNIGNNSPVKLTAYIAAIEKATGRPAIKELLPLQPGDVPDTFADVSMLEAAVGYRPATPVEEGVRRFVGWYRGYFRA